MELTHDAYLAVSVDAAWEVAGDLDALAACLPGAEVAGREGDTWHGALTVKVGPVTTRYEGEVSLAWRDTEAHRVVLDLVADEVGGIGRVQGTLNATFAPDGLGTAVAIVTTLSATGRAAQFGRGVLTDVGQRLLADVVDELERTVLADAVEEALTASIPEPEAERVPVPAWGLPLDDVAEVEALLGRKARGRYDVVVRHDDGSPVVVRNDPLLFDGTPMPTRYWLVGEPERTWVARLEADGGVRRAEAEVDPDELLDAHHRYSAERDAALGEYDGPRPSGGVGGTRTGVKCLHAHYAWFLAGGDDPVGRWVADQLARVAH